MRAYSSLPRRWSSSIRTSLPATDTACSYEDEVALQHAGQLCLLQIDEDDRWSLRFYDCGSYFVFLPDGELKPEEWQQTDSAMFYY